MPDAQELEAYYQSMYTSGHGQREIQDKNRDYYRSHLRSLVAMSNRSPGEMAIADVGCSFPVLLHESLLMGFKLAVGVEHDHEATAFGVACGVTMVSPDKFESQVPDGTIDIIRFSHTVEHLLDPVAMLSVAYAKVRDGGIIHITQPAYPQFAAERCTQNLRDDRWPDHLHFFSPLSLLTAVRRAGFRVTRFFTHQNAHAELARFAPFVDLASAARELADVAGCGDPYFGRLNNYPVFAGENSALYATK